ncbi:MAG: SH3 domain-containing protein [Clostridia bacterium]|nr:SH3 domain-containing protein [Clostridia bacterium]
MKRMLSILICLSLLYVLLPVVPAMALSDVMCVTNCSEWVSLREDMSTSSKRLAKVYLGELVTDCKMAYDGFIECQFGGKTGYIQSKYLKDTDYSSGESFPGNQMVVNVEEWASMWDSPSTKSTRVTKVPVGSIVTSCVGTTGGFILCEYKNGRKTYKGYISTSYLKKANYSASTQNSKATPIEGSSVDGITMTVTNCNDWVSLREKASASSARLAKVPLGATVDQCIQTSDSFIYCHYRGIYGYIQSQYLTAPGINEPVIDYPEIVPQTDPQTDTAVNSFNNIPILPDYASFQQVGRNVVMETYQGYTIIVQHVDNQFEEMLAVCYDLQNQPLWRLYAQSLEELSDVVQLDAFVAGTIEDPQLIWYINGLGFYSYSYGPALQLRWFLPNEVGLNITDSITHTEDYDGSFFVAFSNVLMHISPEGQLLWRTECEDSTLYWPVSIDIDENGISVFYDNVVDVSNTYTEARFTFEGAFQYTTRRIIAEGE